MISRKSSRRLPARSAVWFDRPVTLPPGRAKPATKPVAAGSPAVVNTIGITAVARLTATTGAVPHVTITSTLSRTNSLAISAERSLRPSAQRYSIAMLRASIQPSSRNRCTKAAAQCSVPAGGDRMPFDQLHRREVITLLDGAAAVWPLAACAQQRERMRRIGLLMPRAADDPVGQVLVAAFMRSRATNSAA